MTEQTTTNTRTQDEVRTELEALKERAKKLAMDYVTERRKLYRQDLADAYRAGKLTETDEVPMDWKGPLEAAYEAQNVRELAEVKARIAAVEREIA